ncbi:MAG: ABC transporter permease [Armatimonadetes bacterium]|nr:ABC transporter permease [Armatimonadota bacterium]
MSTEVQTPSTLEIPRDVRAGLPARRLARQFARNRVAVAGLAVLALVVLLTAAGPEIAPHSPVRVRVSERLRPPGAEHWFGTDQFGRDVFSRVLVGTRPTFLAAFIAIGVAAGAGVLLGATAGYASGRVDDVIMRLMEILLAFPGILLALVVITILGTGLVNVMIAVGISLIPVYTRLVRGTMLAVRERDYVQAARAIGCPPARVLVRHMLPNVWAQVAVLSTTALGWAIIAGSTLNFLGFGIRPPTPEWGADLNFGREYLNVAWWMSTAPGVAIVLVILAINFVGDGVTEALDPALRRR